MEVVLALGLFAFVIVALIGLVSVGMKTGRESAEQLDAANLAQSILHSRRLSPTNTLAGFPLPSMAGSSDNLSGPLYLTSEGFVTNDPGQARFACIYRIEPDPVAFQSGIYLCLYWPPISSPEKSAGRFETFCRMPLPIP